MSIYNKNIEALLLKNHLLATQIFAIEENRNFEVFQGNDPVDINILDVKNETFMYAQPVNDVLALAEMKKKYETYPYRYVYGIGNGIFLKMVLQHPALKRILLVESNLELLYIVFNLVDFSKEITTDKLKIELAQNIDFTVAYDHLNHSESKLYARLFELETFSNYYPLIDGDQYSSVLDTMSHTLTHVIMGHGNCPVDSLEGIENHFQNLPDLIQGPKFTKFFGASKGQTAIIVSTGPSLTKQLPLLKKIKDHAIIISVDASFPILEKNGIKPDYVTVLERVPETGKFFENNTPEFQKDVNFICVSIIHEKVKNAIRNGNLIFQMRPHGYTKYFGLDDYGYIGGGMSAANLAHEFAVMLEVQNIIFIGQDLAFGEDDTSHASDHTFSVNEESTDGHNIFVTKYGGEGTIRTTFYWNMFRDGIENIIHRTKSFITSINATEGGARIDGALELSFSDAIDRYVDISFTKTAPEIIYPTPEEIEQNRQIMIDKTNLLFSEAVRIQEEIEALFMKVQSTSEKLVALSETNQLDEIDFDELEKLNLELDEVKSLVDDPNFNTMFMDVLQSTVVQLEIEFAPIHVESATTEIEKKSKLIDWIMKHRYWLFVVAGGLEGQRMTMQRAIENWPEDLKSQIIIPQKKEVEVDQEKYERLKVLAQKEQAEREEKMKENFNKLAADLGI